MSSKKKTEKISVELDRDLVRGVKSEMIRLKSEPGRSTRAGAIRSILHKHLRSTSTLTKDVERVKLEILQEVKILKDEAKDNVNGRKLLITAIMRELELWILEEPNEDQLKSSLIEIVGLLKDATGYRFLPDVKRTHRFFMGRDA